MMMHRQIAQGCHTGNHYYHIYVPWRFNHAYDKVCDICRTPAAWLSGSRIALCDCCAQDWSEWCAAFGLPQKANWDKKYAEFRRYAVQEAVS